MTPDSQEHTEAGDPFANRTPWSLRGAVAVAFVVVLAAMAATSLLQPLTARLAEASFGGDGLRARLGVGYGSMMLSLLVMQVVMAALAVVLAGRYGAERRAVLSLPAAFPVGSFLLGLAGLAVVTLPYSLGIFWLWPDTFGANLKLFADIAASPARWLGALVVVIGAPIAEELLFRGFLLPALAKGRHGFLGAALISTAGWTALHFNYSLAGLIEVFAVGLFLCWLVRRTGNLWINIALHAFYNGLQFVILAFWPRLLGF